VTPDHFADYMQFHNNKLFKPQYRPQPCSYGVRTTAAHAPQGTIAIETQPTTADAIAQPINTLVAHAAATQPMRVQLSASTEISFGGDRYVHGFLSHQFQGEQGPALNFVARARQFSSFVVLLGKISGADTFDPTYAMIVRNKDEFSVPLNMETIPTAKEFKDAISSLSPEQQDFCRAFRSMQLESTLFGVVVIQIKPQLEKLLNLAPDALAKEIQLTEHLMELFIKYQIPADLLSYEEGDLQISEKDPRRLAGVKDHVQKMYVMINEEKDKQLAEKVQEECYNASLRRSASPMQQSAAWGAPEMVMKSCSAPILPAAAPMLPGQRQQAPQQPRQHAAPAPGSGAVDYTQIPQQLDAKFEQLATDAALRPTIITPGSRWNKKSQKGLLSAAVSTSLNTEQQKSTKDEAFDLLDGITRAGALSCDHASLHVVIASTHCFDSNLMDTIVCNNINPIAKVERSMLILANTVHGASVEQMVSNEKYTSIAPELVQNLPAVEAIEAPPAEAAPVAAPHSPRRASERYGGQQA